MACFFKLLNIRYAIEQITELTINTCNFFAIILHCAPFLLIVMVTTKSSTKLAVKRNRLAKEFQLQLHLFFFQKTAIAFKSLVVMV